jgi:hypothetical protein
LVVRTKNKKKYCSKILQKTLLYRVSNDLPPFMVGQNHDSFKLAQDCGNIQKPACTKVQRGNGMMRQWQH